MDAIESRPRRCGVELEVALCRNRVDRKGSALEAKLLRFDQKDAERPKKQKHCDELARASFKEHIAQPSEIRALLNPNYAAKENSRGYQAEQYREQVVSCGESSARETEPVFNVVPAPVERRVLGDCICRRALGVHGGMINMGNNSRKQASFLYPQSPFEVADDVRRAQQGD